MRLSPLFILPLLFTTWQTTFAATVDDCSKINTSGERLACFDSISKQNKPPVRTEQKSKWYFFTDWSVWYHTITYNIRLLSDNQIDKGVNDNKHGVISILCVAQKTRLSLSINDLSTDSYKLLDAHGDDGFVRYQLDKEQPKRMKMTLTETRDLLYIGSPELVISFIKEMLGHDKMLVLVEGYKGNTEILEFSINGLEEAIKPVRQKCNW